MAYDPNREYTFVNENGETITSWGDNGYVRQAVEEGLPLSVNEKGEWFVMPYAEQGADGWLTVYYPDWFEGTPEFEQLNAWINTVPQWADMDNIEQVATGLGNQAYVRNNIKNEYGITDPTVQDNYIQNLYQIQYEADSDGEPAKLQSVFWDGEKSVADVAKMYQNLSKEELSEQVTKLNKWADENYWGELGLEYTGSPEDQQIKADAMNTLELLNTVADNPDGYGKRWGNDYNFNGLLDASGWQNYLRSWAIGGTIALQNLPIFGGLFQINGGLDNSLTKQLESPWAGGNLRGTEGSEGAGTALGLAATVAENVLMFRGAGKLFPALSRTKIYKSMDNLNPFVQSWMTDLITTDLPLDLGIFVNDTIRFQGDVGKALVNPEEQQPLFGSPALRRITNEDGDIVGWTIGGWGPNVAGGLVDNLVGDAIIDLLPLGLSKGGTMFSNALDGATNGGWSRFKEHVAVGNLKLQERLVNTPVIGTGFHKLIEGMMGPANARIISEARQQSIRDGTMDRYIEAQVQLHSNNHNGLVELAPYVQELDRRYNISRDAKTFVKNANKYGGVGKTEKIWSQTDQGRNVNKQHVVNDVLPRDVKNALLAMDRLSELKGEMENSGRLFQSEDVMEEIANLEAYVKNLPQNIRGFGERFSRFAKSVDRLRETLGISTKEYMDALNADPRFANYIPRQALVPDYQRTYSSGEMASPAMLTRSRTGNYSDAYIDPLIAMSMKVEAIGKAYTWNQTAKMVASMELAKGNVIGGKQAIDTAKRLVETTKQLTGTKELREKLRYDETINSLGGVFGKVSNTFTNVNNILNRAAEVNFKSTYDGKQSQQVSQFLNDFNTGKITFADGVKEKAGLSDDDANEMVQNTYKLDGVATYRPDNQSEESEATHEGYAGMTSKGVPYSYEIENGQITSIKQIKDAKRIVESFQMISGNTISLEDAARMGAENMYALNEAMLWHRDNLPNLGISIHYSLQAMGSSTVGRQPYKAKRTYNWRQDEKGHILYDPQIEMSSYWLKKETRPEHQVIMNEGVEPHGEWKGQSYHPKNSNRPPQAFVHETMHAYMLALTVKKYNKAIDSGDRLPLPKFYFEKKDVDGDYVEFGDYIQDMFIGVETEIADLTMERMGHNPTDNQWKKLAYTISRYAFEGGSVHPKYKSESYAEAAVDVWANGENASEFATALIDEARKAGKEYEVAAVPMDVFLENGLDLPKGMFKEDGTFNYPENVKTPEQKAAWLDEWRQKNPYIGLDELKPDSDFVRDRIDYNPHVSVISKKIRYLDNITSYLQTKFISLNTKHGPDFDGLISRTYTPDSSTPYAKRLQKTMVKLFHTNQPNGQPRTYDEVYGAQPDFDSLTEREINTLYQDMYDLIRKPNSEKAKELEKVFFQDPSDPRPRDYSYIDSIRERIASNPLLKELPEKFAKKPKVNKKSKVVDGAMYQRHDGGNVWTNVEGYKRFAADHLERVSESELSRRVEEVITSVVIPGGDTISISPSMRDLPDNIPRKELLDLTVERCIDSLQMGSYPFGGRLAGIALTNPDDYMLALWGEGLDPEGFGKACEKLARRYNLNQFFVEDKEIGDFFETQRFVESTLEKSPANSFYKVSEDVSDKIHDTLLDMAEEETRRILGKALEGNYRLKDDVILYRGYHTSGNVSDRQELMNILRTNEEGVYRDNGMPFVTLSPQVARDRYAGDKGVVVRYLVPKGTKLFYWGYKGRGTNDGGAFVLPPGMYGTVEEVRMPSEGPLEVDVSLGTSPYRLDPESYNALNRPSHVAFTVEEKRNILSGKDPSGDAYTSAYKALTTFLNTLERYVRQEYVIKLAKSDKTWGLGLLKANNQFPFTPDKLKETIRYMERGQENLRGLLAPIKDYAEAVWNAAARLWDSPSRKGESLLEHIQGKETKLLDAFDMYGGLMPVGTYLPDLAKYMTDDEVNEVFKHFADISLGSRKGGEGTERAYSAGETNAPFYNSISHRAKWYNSEEWAGRLEGTLDPNKATPAGQLNLSQSQTANEKLTKRQLGNKLFTDEEYQKANLYDTFLEKEVDALGGKSSAPAILMDRNARYLDELNKQAAQDMLKELSGYPDAVRLATALFSKNPKDSSDSLDEFIIGRVNEQAQNIAERMEGGATEENLNAARATLWGDTQVRASLINMVNKLSPESGVKAASDRVFALCNEQAQGFAAQALPVDLEPLEKDKAVLTAKLLQENEASQQLAAEVEDQERARGRRGDFSQIIHYKEGGNDVYIVTKDPTIASVLKNPNDYKENGVVAESLNAIGELIARTYRSGTTGWNPVALVTNMIRDPIQATLQGGFNPLSAQLSPEVFYRTLRQYGLDDETINTVLTRIHSEASGSTLTAEMRGLDTGINLRGTGYRNNVGRVRNWANRKMDTGFLGNALTVAEMPLQGWESFFRNKIGQESFIKNFLMTRDVDKSMTRAVFDLSNSTTDFSHAIHLFGKATSTVAYLNAAFNGVASFARQFNVDPIGMVVRIVSGVIVPVMGITAWNLSSEERRKAYMNLPEWYRNTRLCLVTADNQVIGVPIPQEFQSFYGTARQLIEYTYEANPYSIPSILAQGAFNMLPVDVAGFVGPDGTFQLQRGLEQMGSGLIPQAVTAIYEFIAERDLFTGQDLSSYNGLQKTINTMTNLFGTGIRQVINDIGYMVGASPQDVPGLSTAETMARNLFGKGFNDATAQFMEMIGEAATVDENGKQTKATGLFAENEKLELQLEKLDKDIATAPETEVAELEEKKKQLVEDFTNKVANMTHKYMQLYTVNGGLEEWQKRKIVTILTLGGGASSSSRGTTESEAANEADLNAWDNAVNRYVEAGLPAGASRESVLNQQNSLELQAALNKYYGSSKQAATDFRNMAEEAELKDIRSEFLDAIDQIYDEAEAAGVSPDYDLIEKIQARYLQSLDAVLVPILQRYGITILNNNEFINAVRNYVSGMVPSDDWRTSTKNSKWHLSTKEYPLAGVDVKKWLIDRYSSSIRQRDIASDPEVTERLESIRVDIEEGRRGAAKGKIDDLMKGVQRANYYISSEDLMLLNEYNNML